MATPSPVPTRADVKKRWRALTEGWVSRREVHDWASIWVEGRDEAIADPMVCNGLQHLHGFDLTYDPENANVLRHGDGEHYVHSDQEIADSLARWETNCGLYDSDPAAYLRLAKERAISKLREEWMGA